LSFAQVFPKSRKFLAIHKFLPLFRPFGINQIARAICGTPWYNLSTKNCPCF
jgi:hypothetical protein